MTAGMKARYDSTTWSRRSGASREWVLEVEEPGLGEGGVGDGQLLPDELLSVHSTGITLTPEQRSTLSRLELTSITEWQIRFEAIVQAGFASLVASADDLREGRITFILHEIGEEAGHQRLFQRLLSELPRLPRSAASERQRRRQGKRLIRMVMRFPAVLFALVLAGEEIIDRFQDQAADHDGTDPFVREVYEFHRAEEANHVAFVNAVYAEAWVRASAAERRLVKHVVPRLIQSLFDDTITPEAYAAAGLPQDTWEKVRTSTAWRSARAASTQPVLDALVEAGALDSRSLPRAWRELCAAPDIAR